MTIRVCKLRSAIQSIGQTLDVMWDPTTFGMAVHMFSFHIGPGLSGYYYCAFCQFTLERKHGSWLIGMVLGYHTRRGVFSRTNASVYLVYGTIPYHGMIPSSPYWWSSHPLLRTPKDEAIKNELPPQHE
eukprot:scaffold449_cov184-Amphora_coffeaeformis.AAC.4